MKRTYKGKEKRIHFLLAFLFIYLQTSFVRPLHAGQGVGVENHNYRNLVLATVNDHKITVSDLKKEMLKQGGLTEERFNDMGEKMKVLDEMIRFELFISDAYRAGYDKDPEIVDYLRKRMVQKYLQENIEPQIEDLSVTGQEIEDYYQEHIDEFQRPTLKKIAMIWIKASDKTSRKERERIRERAEEAFIEASKGTPSDNSFGEIARKYSDDMETKYRGGVVGWFDPKDGKIKGLPTEVFDVALSLEEVGEISPVIDTIDGYYIIKLAAKKVFQSVSLNQAEARIRYILSSEKKRTFYHGLYEGMKKGANIDIDLDVLGSIKGEKSKEERNEHRPPSFPVDIK